uniref:Uncharacterized protein LOC100372730 n=1 Tax=Saccoglossus kowalevskii TaxID=10224 RepID=A0ABM0ME97_SACKO|nr:PREDICTED: uncharacterized protein LOC100372730 [Saccoglossus kowalevskii]
MITSFKMASYESEIECQYQEMMKQLEKEKRQTTEQQLQNRLRRQRLAQDADNVSTKAMAAELGNHVLHVLRKNNEHDVGPSEDQIQNVLQMTMQQMKDQLNEQREDDYSELSGSYSSRGPSLSRSRSPHQMGPAARDGRMDQFGDFRGPHHMRQGQQFPPRLQFRPGQKVPSDQLPLLMRNIERQLRAGNMNQRQECHLRSLYDYYAYQLSGHEGRSDRFARGPSSAFGDQSIEPWQDMQQGDEYSSNMSNYGRGGMYSPRGRNGTYPSGSQQEFDRAAAFGRHQFRGRQTFDHATRFGGHGGGRGRGMHPPRGRGQQGFDRAVGFGRVRHAFDHDANVGRGGMYSPRGRGLEMYGGGPAFNQGGMHYSGAEDEMYFSGDDYSYDHSGSFQEDSMYPSEVPYSQDVYSQSWVTDDSQWRKRRYSDLGNEKVILRHGTSKWFCKPCKLDFSDIYTLKEHVEHEEHLFRKQSHNAREESAIIKQGEDKKWYCVVCALYFDDWDSLTVHLRSTTHMKRKVDVDNGAPVPSQSTSDTTSDEENPIIKKCGDNTWYCEVCTEYCDDWDELTAHIRSEIHLQNRSHDEMFMNQSSRPKHYSGGYGDEFGGSGPGSEGNHSYTVCLESPLVLELMQKCGLRVNKMYNSLEELLAAENVSMHVHLKFFQYHGVPRKLLGLHKIR